MVLNTRPLDWKSSTLKPRPLLHTYYLNSSICVWKTLVFQIIWMSHHWFLYWFPVSLLSVVSRVFEKLINNRIIFMFSDFQYGFRSSWSTATFWQLPLIEGLLTEFGMLVFFKKLSLIEFLVRCLALFIPYSQIRSFKLFWMGNPHKNI